MPSRGVVQRIRIGGPDMSEILVLFACGHTKAYQASDPRDEAPECPLCGVREVQRVVAPAPRFTMNGQPYLSRPDKEPTHHG